MEGQFSPDGRWIAYTSDETGRDEVYVQPAIYEAGQADRSGQKWLVSSQGGAQPRWRRDGTELFYRSTGGVLTSVGVHGTRAGLKFGAPSPLFALPSAPQLRGTFTYDVTRDGQRFIALAPKESPDDSSITIISNWRAGLN